MWYTLSASDRQFSAKSRSYILWPAHTTTAAATQSIRVRCSSIHHVNDHFWFGTPPTPARNNWISADRPTMNGYNNREDDGKIHFVAESSRSLFSSTVLLWSDCERWPWPEKATVAAVARQWKWSSSSNLLADTPLVVRTHVCSEIMNLSNLSFCRFTKQHMIYFCWTAAHLKTWLWHFFLRILHRRRPRKRSAALFLHCRPLRSFAIGCLST